MDENPKKYMKVREEENPDNLHEETAVNSQSKFSEININQKQKKIRIISKLIIINLNIKIIISIKEIF